MDPTDSSTSDRNTPESTSPVLQPGIRLRIGYRNRTTRDRFKYQDLHEVDKQVKELRLSEYSSNHSQNKKAERPRDIEKMMARIREKKLKMDAELQKSNGLNVANGGLSPDAATPEQK